MPHRHDFLLLNHTEQLGLEIQRDLGHLVQE